MSRYLTYVSYAFVGAVQTEAVEEKRLRGILRRFAERVATAVEFLLTGGGGDRSYSV